MSKQRKEQADGEILEPKMSVWFFVIKHRHLKYLLTEVSLEQSMKVIITIVRKPEPPYGLFLHAEINDCIFFRLSLV